MLSIRSLNVLRLFQSSPVASTAFTCTSYMIRSRTAMSDTTTAVSRLPNQRHVLSPLTL